MSKESQSKKTSCHKKPIESCKGPLCSHRVNCVLGGKVFSTLHLPTLHLFCSTSGYRLVKAPKITVAAVQKRTVDCR